MNARIHALCVTAAALTATAIGHAQTEVITLTPVDDAYLSNSGAEIDMNWNTPVLEQFGPTTPPSKDRSSSSTSAKSPPARPSSRHASPSSSPVSTAGKAPTAPSGEPQTIGYYFGAKQESVTNGDE